MGNGIKKVGDEKLNSSTERTKHANRITQRHQNTKPTENDEIFRDISNVTSFSVVNSPIKSSSFPSSSRWADVHTGHVKDRANTFGGAEEDEKYKSPEIQRKIFKSSSWRNKDLENVNSGLEALSHELTKKDTNMEYVGKDVDPTVRNGNQEIL